MKIAAVTGYKPHELGIFKADEPAVAYIKKALFKELAAMADEGLEWVLISGQLGTELWAAETVFELQADYPQLQLSVTPPFSGQEEKWNESNRELYEYICGDADFFAPLSKLPYSGPWQFRNRDQFLLQKADCLLAFYDEERPGSPQYIVEAAKRHQETSEFEVRLIGFYDLQLLVEEEAEANYDGDSL